MSQQDIAWMILLLAAVLVTWAMPQDLEDDDAEG